MSARNLPNTAAETIALVASMIPDRTLRAGDIVMEPMPSDERIRRAAHYGEDPVAPAYLARMRGFPVIGLYALEDVETLADCAAALNID